ncbi:MAG TPA: acyl-CoA thioesterase II, partial [Nannocystis exedens]|nr:acyl-CoA thioesterase II [Nannocystis exedens]
SVHSLHGYFLRTGDASKPIIYDVDRIRNGKSFTTRRVVAIQKGRAIFSMGASFQIEESGFDHQVKMPEVPGPEELASETELARRVVDRIPPPLRARAVADKPIELREVKPVNPLAPEVREPKRYVWVRASDVLPDDPQIHRFLLAYASDFHFMTTAMFPHGISWLTPGMQTASLDHAMWFHREFRLDDWLLYAIESPSSSNARGLARGHFFNRAGELVASTVQEGLIRKRVPASLG